MYFNQDVIKFRNLKKVKICFGNKIKRNIKEINKKWI